MRSTRSPATFAKGRADYFVYWLGLEKLGTRPMVLLGERRADEPMDDEEKMRIGAFYTAYSERQGVPGASDAEKAVELDRRDRERLRKALDDAHDAGRMVLDEDALMEEVTAEAVDGDDTEGDA